MFSQLNKLVGKGAFLGALLIGVCPLKASELTMENSLAVNQSKARKVLLTDHPEYFRAVFKQGRCFLPVTQLYTSYMGSLAPDFEYQDIRELINFKQSGNWKFVLISGNQGSLEMRAGEKYSFGEFADYQAKIFEDHKAESGLVSPGSLESVKFKYRGLHHPTLASTRQEGFGKVVTAGILRFEKNLNTIVVDVDSGNYGLGVETLSHMQRSWHLAKISCFFNRNGIPSQKIWHNFEGKFVEGLALYPGKEVIARMIIEELILKIL